MTERSSEECVANLLVYRTHDLDEIASKVEEVVRKDVGSAMRVPYRVHPGTSERLTAREFGRDIAGLAFGFQPTTVGSIEFDLPWHRPALLTVVMDRVGLNSIARQLHYSIDLARPVSEPVGFQLAKLLRAGRFTGGATATRLNGDPALGKALGKVVLAETAIGMMAVNIPAGLEVLPIDETSSRLLVLTLPKVGLMSATTEAGKLLASARSIESRL